MKHQPPANLGPLFEQASTPKRFDVPLMREAMGKPDPKIPTPKGDTFDSGMDGERLGKQYVAVVKAMSDGKWHTLGSLSMMVGAPEASVSARLRDMRRDGWEIDRRRVEGGNGLHEYAARRASAE